jgi:hypothetical protein
MINTETTEDRMICLTCSLLAVLDGEPVCEVTNHVIPGGFLNYPRI